MIHTRALYCLTILFATSIGLGTSTLQGQQVIRKIKRAEAPKLDPAGTKDLFFSDVSAALDGKLPSALELASSKPTSSPKPTSNNTAMNNSPDSTATTAASSGGWATYISPTTIEDEVKQTKLRLDQIVTTPAKFAGGGFTEARVQFSELTVLFGIIAEYPSQVRWQKSSLAARDGFAKMSANAKVGSTQAYNEAKQRLQELADMLNGTELSIPPPEEQKGWEQLVDRQPLMQLFEVAYQQNLTTMTANAAAFKENSEDVLRYAELVAAYTAVINKEGMPDADDTDYRTHSDKMLASALEVIQAVKTSNADLARQAVGQIGQACTNCHNSYR